MKPGIYKKFKLYPNEATELLKKRIEPVSLSSLDPVRISRFIVAMHDGQWDFNREVKPITLDRNDLIMDGLHRLSAISLLDHSVEVCIVKTS